MEQIFSEKNIQVVSSVKDWQEAIRLASYPLVQNGNITQRYIEMMIKSVKENGPYMVLTDYFALMHARPGDGVIRKGMSLLVTKNSVDVEGKPVKIFLVMAAIDNTSHLRNLQNIIKILMNNNEYQTILNGNKNEILNIFRRRVKS